MAAKQVRELKKRIKELEERYEKWWNAYMELKYNTDRQKPRKTYWDYEPVWSKEVKEYPVLYFLGTLRSDWRKLLRFLQKNRDEMVLIVYHRKSILVYYGENRYVTPDKKSSHFNSWMDFHKALYFKLKAISKKDF